MAHTLTFSLTDEHIELLAAKWNYQSTISIDTGEIVNKQPVLINKEISKVDFVYNFIAKLLDTQAESKKRDIAKIEILKQVETIQVESKLIIKLPIATQEEIEAAKIALTPVLEVEEIKLDGEIEEIK